MLAASAASDAAIAAIRFAVGKYFTSLPGAALP
jgi:hypothetical protein